MLFIEDLSAVFVDIISAEGPNNADAVIPHAHVDGNDLKSGCVPSGSAEGSSPSLRGVSGANLHHHSVATVTATTTSPTSFAASLTNSTLSRPPLSFRDALSLHGKIKPSAVAAVLFNRTPTPSPPPPPASVPSIKRPPDVLLPTAEERYLLNSIKASALASLRMLVGVGDEHCHHCRATVADALAYPCPTLRARFALRDDQVRRMVRARHHQLTAYIGVWRTKDLGSGYVSLWHMR